MKLIEKISAVSRQRLYEAIAQRNKASHGHNMLVESKLGVGDCFSLI